VIAEGDHAEMAAFELTDAEIAAMSPRQRQALIWRLARPSSQVITSAAAHRMRRRRLTLIIAAAVLLIPWIAYLAVTLPDRYVAENWSLAWVGFDVLLFSMFVITAVLGWLRRQLLVLAAFGTGLLLICDAWFDVTTAGPDDRWLSIVSAAVLELPVAAVLIGSAFRLMRALAERLWALEPGAPLWTVPLPIADLFTEPEHHA
jgi:hypothetical protein